MHNPSAPLTAEQVAHAITDDAGRAVMAACVGRARSVKEICQETGVPTTTAYRQIHRLEELGVLVVERSAMTPDGRKYDLYRSRVLSIHLDLDEGGARVTWEPNLTIEERVASLWEHMRSQADPVDIPGVPRSHREHMTAA